MRCYDAIIKEMQDNTNAIRDPCARQTARVAYLQQNLQTALGELDAVTAIAKQKTDTLAELRHQLMDDLKFQRESVVMSLRREGKPTSPNVVYTFTVTTATGNVTMELNGAQFNSALEVFRLQRVMADQAHQGVIDYSEISVCQRDIGMEATLHT
jgi:hypothetical protein